MLFHLKQELAIGCIKDFDHFRWPANRHHPMVRADISCQHGIVFFTHFKNAFARLHIPGHCQARLATTAAPGKQQVTIAAEFK